MSDVFIYSYRYMWRVDGSDSVNFKIVTDTLEGLAFFEDSLKSSVDNLVAFGKEYLCQYNCSKIGLFDTIFKKEGDK